MHPPFKILVDERDEGKKEYIRQLFSWISARMAIIFIIT